MKTAFSVLLTLLLVCGCATTPPEALTQAEISQLDYGPYPDNYQKLVEGYLAQTLPDANAVEYQVGTPFKGYLQHGPLFGGKVFLDGYFADVWIKTKEANAQEQHFGVVMKNGVVLMQLSDRDMQSVKRGI